MNVLIKTVKTQILSNICPSDPVPFFHITGTAMKKTQSFSVTFFWNKIYDSDLILEKKTVYLILIVIKIIKILY